MHLEREPFGSTRNHLSDPEEEVSMARILKTARILLAFSLLCGVIFMDRTGKRLGETSADRIFQEISVDYGEIVVQKGTELIKAVRNR